MLGRPLSPAALPGCTASLALPPLLGRPLTSAARVPLPPAAGLLSGSTQVLVNSQLEAHLGQPLATGDVIDLYADPTVPAVPALPPLRAAQAAVGSSAVVRVRHMSGQGAGRGGQACT